MQYLEFSIQVPDASREAVSARLHEMGSLGLSEENARLIAYFDGKADGEAISAGLEAFRKVLAGAGLDPAFTFSWSAMPDQDWNETWKQTFEPIDAGTALTILPPWKDPPANRTPLFIDPGMAFGTGHHETTRTCVGLIESLAHRYRGGRLLDVGTGTGILAIAAARLGFAEALGVDTDPLAVDAARRNAASNGLDNVTVIAGGIAEAPGSYEVIVANLISGTLIRIARDIVSRLAAGGTVILSGMLAGQESDVVTAMEHAGLRLQETHCDGKWVTLVCTAAV